MVKNWESYDFEVKSSGFEDPGFVRYKKNEPLGIRRSSWYRRLRSHSQGRLRGDPWMQKSYWSWWRKTSLISPWCWNESSKLKCSPDMFPIYCVEPGELLHVVQARDPDWQGINITETVNFVKSQMWHLQWKIDFGARWSLTIECWQQIAPRGDDGRMSKAVEDPWWLDVDNCWHEPWVGSVAKPLDGLSGRPVHIMGWFWQLEMNWKKVERVRDVEMENLEVTLKWEPRGETRGCLSSSWSWCRSPEEQRS